MYSLSNGDFGIVEREIWKVGSFVKHWITSTSFEQPIVNFSGAEIEVNGEVMRVVKIFMLRSDFGFEQSFPRTVIGNISRD